MTGAMLTAALVSAEPFGLQQADRLPGSGDIRDAARIPG
jgi:hypothetical protein